MFDFSIVTSWVHGLLTSLMPVGLAVFLECVIVGVCLLLMYAVIAILMIFMERKVCAAFQCRLGPVRVGPWGTLQVICDVFKMLTKEIITIRRSDKFLYNLAPYIVILASVLAFACLPVNKGLEVLDFNVGIFFMMAASSIGVVGILLAGWSSNNKYSLIGAMRSGAQMISYELSIGLSILTIIVLTDTMQFSEIVARQADGWFLFKGHIPALIAFVIYLIAGNAEVNRGPFDLPEAESELTAGYHTEYSGMSSRCAAHSAESSARMRSISVFSRARSSRSSLFAFTAAIGSMNSVAPEADTSCTRPGTAPLCSALTGTT